MEAKKIIDGNKLIADFLGWSEEGEKGTWYRIIDVAKYVAYSIHNNHPHNDLPFHRSWEYLMPVIEKIDKLRYKGFPIIVNIGSDGAYIGINNSNASGEKYSEKYDNKLEIANTLNWNYWVVNEGEEEPKIIGVWNAVVRFIQWWNENNKN